MSRLSSIMPSWMQRTGASTVCAGGQHSYPSWRCHGNHCWLYSTYSSNGPIPDSSLHQWSGASWSDWSWHLQSARGRKGCQSTKGTISTLQVERQKTDSTGCNIVSKFIIPYLYEAQHVSGDTPPVIRSLKLHQQPLVLHTWKVVGRVSAGRWQRPATTRSTFIQMWNKIWYTVASCWIFYMSWTFSLCIQTECSATNTQAELCTRIW